MLNDVLVEKYRQHAGATLPFDAVDKWADPRAGTDPRKTKFAMNFQLMTQQNPTSKKFRPIRLVLVDVDHPQALPQLPLRVHPIAPAHPALAAVAQALPAPAAVAQVLPPPAADHPSLSSTAVVD